MRLPGRAATPQFRGRELDADLLAERIDRDAVAVLYKSDRAADRGLRGNMSDDEAVTAPGEAPVGDERHFGTETAPHERARRAEHLAHARAPARALVADDDDVARLDAPREDRLGRALLAVEDPRAAGEVIALLARELGHGSVRSQVAVENDEVAVLLKRSGKGVHNVLPAHVHG